MSPSGVKVTGVPEAVSAPKDLRLFRAEALSHRQSQRLGTVLLTPAPAHGFFTLFATLAMAAVFCLLVFGKFTHRARVDGWLSAHEGLVRIFAPQPGLVTAMYVREDTLVRRGDRLLKLSGQVESASFDAAQTEIVRKLTELRESLRREQTEQDHSLSEQQRAYEERLATLQAERDQVEADVGTMKARVRLAQRNAAINAKVRAQGYISEPQFEAVENERLDQESRLGALERQQIELKREQVTLQGEMRELPLKMRERGAGLARDLANTEQELVQAQAKREVIVTAPRDGLVTAVLVEEGAHATGATPLLTIVPVGTVLEAHLYGTSRSVGFVRPGQKVLLRYQAYPYQKFGHYEGVVVSVSHSAVGPADLPAQMSGLFATEPVYPIVVRLARQSVTAYGRQVPLQPGLLLQADIAVETRQLYEWVLDPIYTMSGVWKG